MDILTAILAILAMCLGLWYYFLKDSSHFERSGVPFEPPLPIFGNVTRFILRLTSLPELIRASYDRFQGARYYGFYFFDVPVFVIRDMDLVNSIAVKNFDNFCDHRSIIPDTEPLVSKNLFQLRGNEWRNTRKVISPIFTSSKMKMMYHLVWECADSFTDFVTTESSRNGKDPGCVLNMKDVFTRFTSDVIATCAYGIKVDSLKNPNNEFYLLARKIIDFNGALSLKVLLNIQFPSLFRFLGLKVFSQRITDYFSRVIIDTVDNRLKNGIVRPDMLQLMLEARNNSDESFKFDVDHMIPQAFVFFVAGFESLSTFLCFVVYELAVNPRVREKLQREVDQVVEDSMREDESKERPSYETLGKMKYLDMVINETLRLYPAVGTQDRVCVKEFELPPPLPGGKPVKVPVDSTVWFPVYALHRNSSYFPEPDKFNPERFLDDSGNQLSAHIPFSVGPRICIANRFALMVSKIVIFALMARLELETCPKTPIPMLLSRKSFIIMPKDQIYVKLKPRCNEIVRNNS